MTDERSDPSAQDKQVDEILAAYLEAVAAGGTPDRQALLLQHPNLAAELNAFFTNDASLRRLMSTSLPGGTASAGNTAAWVSQHESGALAPPAQGVDLGPTESDLIPAAAATQLRGPIGDYELLEEVGRGGMGVVYKARQNQLKRLVALKMILAGDHAGSQAVLRFRSEAEAVARLQHPNIVQVHEIGDHQGHPYFSLEYIGGGSLAQRLARRPLPPREAARLIETLARAMDYAHRHHIIHRDLKPANVLLTPDGIPKIADFGLAKQLETSGGQTQTGAIIGTPSYMAPEQAVGEGKKVGPEADVYALGAILYECLTGRPPFKAATPFETALQVTLEEPVSPARLQPGVPRDLETICMKCLQKATTRRYGSALALAEDLRRFQANEPITARPVSLWERGAKWAKRRPAVAGLLGAIAGLTAAAILILTLAWQHAQAGWGRAESEEKKANAALGQVQDEKKRVDEALKREEQLRREADDQRKKYQRLYAGQLLDRGISLGEQDDVRGLHWMVRALQNVGKDDADLERAIRLNLASLAGPTHRLRFILPRSNYNGIAYHPRDSTLLTWSTSGVEHWDTVTGKLLDQLPLQANVYQAAYNGDGTKIATSSAENARFFVRVWDAKTGQQFGDGLKLEAAGAQLAFSPDGKRLAVANNRFEMTLFDVDLGRVVPAAAVSTAGLLATRTGSGPWPAVIALYPGRIAGKPIGEPIKHAGSVSVMAFSPDSKTLLTVGFPETTARLWDAGTGKPIGQPMKHESVIYTAAFNPDGKLIATGTANKLVKLWNAKTAEAAGSGPTLLDGTAVRSLAFLSNTLLATGGNDRMVRVWNVTTGQLVGTPLAFPSIVPLVRPNLIFTHSDRAVRLFTGSGFGNPNGAPLPHQNYLVEALPSPDSKTAATRDGSNAVRVWETAPMSPEPPYLLPGPRGVVAVGRYGQTVLEHKLSGPKSQFQVWQLSADQPPALFGKLIETMEPLSDTPLLLSPDGKMVAAINKARNKLFLWDVETGARSEAVTFFNYLHSAVFSEDGTTVLARGTVPGGNVSALYDVKTNKQRGKLMKQTINAPCGVFSPDGKIVATSDTDGVVWLRDAASGEPLQQKMEHRGRVTSLYFSCDGKYLLTASDDRTARLWHVDTGKPASLPLPHPSPVLKAVLSPDGKTIFTATDDNRGRLWDVATAKPISPFLERRPYWTPWTADFRPDGKSVVCRVDGPLVRIKVPPPLEGDVERLKLWVEVLTGLELDDDGVCSALDGPAWQQRKEHLEKLGGMPLR